jgi:5-methylcytosine-specific restriction endonuclease McrA
MDLVRYGKTPGEVDRCRKCGMSVPMKRKSCDSCLAVAVQNERQRARRRRKARQRGVVSEPYTLGEIAARDRHRCGICRKAVPMTGVVVPHPKAPTIDHVLPLAAGGHDVRANVQLAHFLCNSTKGAGGGFQQLALIGWGARMQRRAVLEQLQRKLLEEFDSETGKDTAAISRELRAVTAELESLAPAKESTVDDLAAKRAARRTEAAG